MERYYLGIRVWVAEIPVGWCWALWPDGRWFLHWADQLETTPWGGK